MAKRRQFSTDFKAKVALEAIRGELTLAEIAKKYDVHPNMIAGWKRRLIEQSASLFARGVSDQDKDADARIKELHAKIGQLTIEADFLKKGLNP
jgi:transposase